MRERCSLCAGGSPAAGQFLLLAQKKLTKEKGAPVHRPLARVTLRYSMRRAAAELALVRRRSEASAQTVLAESPRRICVSRRLTGDHPKPAALRVERLVA